MGMSYRWSPWEGDGPRKSFSEGTSRAGAPQRDRGSRQPGPLRTPTAMVPGTWKMK